ncbi:MAG: prepilin peptidase, partial [Planctomycetia bacterium]
MSINVVAFVSTDLLPDATVAAFFCVVAANLGSFLNVVAHRVPRGASVVGGGSRCPACGNPVRWRDNIPVLGWLMLAGRCRDCRASIALRYPLVEAVAGLIGLIGAAELLSGGRTWPAGRFGTGRT